MRWCAYLVVTFCLLACSAKTSSQNLVRQSLSESTEIACVALPAFIDFTNKEKKAGYVVGDIAATYFASKYAHSFRGRNDIQVALENQNITLPRDANVPFALWLGKLFAVDAVLLGSVLEYGYSANKGQSTGTPFVNLEAMLVSVEKQQIIWSGKISKSGHDSFNGMRQPLSRVAIVAVEELLSQLPLRKQSDRTGDFSGGCKPLIVSMDFDGDGILNLADKCAMRPEDKNGYEDFDGCPDAMKNKAKYLDYLSVKGNQIVLKEDVHFEDKKTELTERSIEIIEQLAGFLKHNQQIKKLMIEGFPLSTDSEKFRERISFLRANRVKEKLIEFGVDFNRLIAVGYGSHHNKKRRNVEFTIVE